ncbi:MAG: hypothetical protein FD130_1751 [Halothiobacillaceae bacterium]|nr:MAG: hypothetical protein FD130_1751 [Halothiobacillaceae bacterium]
MVDLYDTDEEKRQHLGAIHFIASRYNLDEEMIRSLYENSLEKIKANAHVKNYLSVLAIRQVNEILQHRSHQQEEQTTPQYQP